MSWQGIALRSLGWIMAAAFTAGILGRRNMPLFERAVVTAFWPILLFIWTRERCHDAGRLADKLSWRMRRRLP